MKRESNLSLSKSLESLSFPRQEVTSLSALPGETETEKDRWRRREGWRRECGSREGGWAGNTSMPWASGTNYTREGMSVRLCVCVCLRAHTHTHIPTHTHTHTFTHTYIIQCKQLTGHAQLIMNRQTSIRCHLVI